MKQSRVFLGIGSNLDNPLKNIQESVQRLIKRDDVIAEKFSSIYLCEPWGLSEQPEFLNCVIKIRTEMSPFELLEEIQKIEQEMGRRKVGSEKRWGPRIIDLDILAYGCEKVEADDLKIPHPRIQDRNFVLLPLREIEQFWIHPELKFSIDEMIHLCIDKCKVEHYLMPAEWVKWVK